MRVTSRKRLVVVEGYVWCHKLGEIHDDKLDPYHYGETELGPWGFDGEDMRCQPSDHIKVYARQ